MAGQLGGQHSGVGQFSSQTPGPGRSQPQFGINFAQNTITYSRPSQSTLPADPLATANRSPRQDTDDNEVASHDDVPRPDLVDPNDWLEDAVGPTVAQYQEALQGRKNLSQTKRTQVANYLTGRDLADVNFCIATGISIVAFHRQAEGSVGGQRRIRDPWTAFRNPSSAVQKKVRERLGITGECLCCARVLHAR